MFAIPIALLILLLLLLLLLHTHLPSVTATIMCYYDDYLRSPQPLVADCLDAIAMIPCGALPVDRQRPLDPPNGTQPSRLNLLLPQSARDRKFFVPAAFKSNTCVVLVSPALARFRSEPLPPMHRAASVMYTMVWPEVKVVAAAGVAQCIRPEARGRLGQPCNVARMEFGSVIDGNRRVYFDVEVRSGREWKEDGWVVEDDGFKFNVYERGGTASGRGNKGSFNLEHHRNDLWFKYAHDDDMANGSD